MDYFAIIRRAYEMTIKHKFLWVFGIFAGSYGGIKGISSSSSDFSQSFRQLTGGDWTAFLNQYWGVLVGIMTVVGLFVLLHFILGIISQGGIISSVAKLDKGNHADLYTGFSIGVKKFWKVLGVCLAYFLMIAIALIIWTVPTFALILGNMAIVGIIWGILLLFVSLLFWLMIGLIMPYSFRVAVLGEKGVFDSIRQSLHFFQRHWLKLALMYLLLLAFGVAFGVALMLAVVIVAAILLLLGWGLFVICNVLGVVYAILAGIAFLIACITVAGAFGAFSSSVLTLTYQDLTKKS